jgi:phosphohistidine phosphatase
MYLYLVQHGAALNREVDPERPLTEEGRSSIRKVARYLALSGKLPIAKIFHSGKLRAQQTAEIIAGELGLKGKVEEGKELNPQSLPWGWVERLADMQDNIMIIGHLPHLKRLTALLICQDESKACVEFRNGGVVCLARNESGIWSLQWILIPEIIS